MAIPRMSRLSKSLNGFHTEFILERLKLILHATSLRKECATTFVEMTLGTFNETRAESLIIFFYMSVKF